jgi:hypothetical protein
MLLETSKKSRGEFSERWKESLLLLFWMEPQKSVLLLRAEV